MEGTMSVSGDLPSIGAPTVGGKCPDRSGETLVKRLHRIRANRFYTKDYRPEIYTLYGIEGVKTVKLYDLIQHHFRPALLRKDRNAPTLRLWQR